VAIALAVTMVASAGGCDSSARESGGGPGAGPLAGASRPPSAAAQAGVETEITSPPVTNVPATAATATSAAGSTTTVSPPPRALLIGDSTLLAVERYRVLGVLLGFEYVYSAESCRTLGVPSCGDPPVPPNALEAIVAADGMFDTVVVMAGYDEWWTSFPQSFDEVYAAAVAKGATTVLFLTFREGVGYVAPDGSTANEAFVRNNVTVRERAASGRYPALRIADWFAYTATTTDWLASDGIHLTHVGARGVADYISRWIAHLAGRPCPMPWERGGPIDAPCPNPDTHGPVSDVMDLYG
jgi:hypothetical protein